MQTIGKIMPLFFGFISWTLPAGLVVYFLTGNIFRIGQQSLIVKLEDRDGKEGTKEEKKQNDKEDDVENSIEEEAESRRKNRKKRKRRK